MRILVVDDEKSVADTLVMILQREGHDCRAAYNGPSALQQIESFIPDCVISDVIMPGMDGIQLCATIRGTHPGCHILLFSGQGLTHELIEKARREGHSWELLPKPIDPDELLAKLASSRAASRNSNT
jgi:CheY-like chemotaxis protein